MSALARYFNEKGVNVCGYDKVESVLCKELELEGINIHYRVGVDNIPSQIKDADCNEMLIIYTPAVSLENKEHLKTVTNNFLGNDTYDGRN